MTELTNLSRFKRELGAFLEDLPKGVSSEARDALISLQKSLDGPAGEKPVSPGDKAVQKASEPTRGTGVHFSKAVTGVDIPSEGQTS